MRRALPLFILLCVSPFLRAEPITLPASKPVAQLEMPEDWAPEISENGLEAVSPDGSIYVAIGYVDEKSVGQFLENALTYLENHGVQVDTESIHQEEDQLNGMDVVEVSMEGQDVDGPCLIKLALFGVSEKDGLMLLYWAAPDAIDKNAEAVASLIASIKPVDPEH